MNDENIDDVDSTAPTLKPPPKPLPLSERPTLPIKKGNTPKKSLVRMYLHLIIIALVLTLICEIFFIAHNASSNQPAPRPMVTFNLPPIVMPPAPAPSIIEHDAGISVTPSPNTLPPSINSKPPVKNIMPTFPPIYPPTGKDYGINDLINPYDAPIIYKL